MPRTSADPDVIDGALFAFVHVTYLSLLVGVVYWFVYLRRVNH